MVTTIVRYGYAPIMLIGVNGAAIALAHAAWAEVCMAGLILIAIGLSFAAERVLPYSDVWNEPISDSRRDVAHALINETSLLLTVLVVPVLAMLNPFSAWWPSSLPFVVQVVIAIFVTDLGVTLVHLASHRVGWLWRFHAVHHSVKRFYGFNGLMKHPLHGALELAAGITPLLILGLTKPVAEVLTVAIAVQLLLQHSNADYRVGPLRKVLALNEGHRFHHLKWAGIGDVNFGLFTLTWDHALRTFSFDPDRRFRSDDLGMAAKPNYPAGYLAQLAEPFRASGACKFGAMNDDATVSPEEVAR
ncbi:MULTISPECIES: sterol desaturase family protein [Mycobacteriaceae]|uniref:Fatty acid hydroxylase n=1 Tax=Mycolicibacterium iranicum TaxID=912594 RepID=A0A1X1WDX9_MYCIR|nr:sterol desaturase family protein [Mycolicibacterium iranicum]MCZ0732556.1 sterol desaturase family protein [Mycolicibacterium iranicum]ORV84781.1 fatty acid hydroxylase [Mycolicibacterium iranicum]